MPSFFKNITDIAANIFKLKNIKEIASAYYDIKPQEDLPNTGRYQRESFSRLNFKLEMFHFGYPEADTRWIAYERLSPPVKTIDKFDWKFNLAIHKDDLARAFPIVADLANELNLGLFKIMSQSQANRVQQNDTKTMIGREIVIYRNANLELDAEKWIQIITKIESSLKKAGIRSSTDTPPLSNKKLGKYTSYTHGAWTNEKMDVPFSEGIVETALDDEDLFRDYEYDEQNQVPMKKTMVGKGCKPGRLVTL